MNFVKSLLVSILGYSVIEMYNLLSKVLIYI